VFTECYKGTGEACGSAYLDYKFGKWLEDRLGPQLASRLLRGKRINAAVSYFENTIKRQFYPYDNSCDLGYQIPLNCGEDYPSIELEDGYLKMTKSYSSNIGRFLR
jgi:hypothetical protein